MTYIMTKDGKRTVVRTRNIAALRKRMGKDVTFELPEYLQGAIQAQR